MLVDKDKDVRKQEFSRVMTSLMEGEYTVSHIWYLLYKRNVDATFWTPNNIEAICERSAHPETAGTVITLWAENAGVGGRTALENLQTSTDPQLARMAATGALINLSDMMLAIAQKDGLPERYPEVVVHLCHLAYCVPERDKIAPFLRVLEVIKHAFKDKPPVTFQSDVEEDSHSAAIHMYKETDDRKQEFNRVMASLKKGIYTPSHLWFIGIYNGVRGGTSDINELEKLLKLAKRNGRQLLVSTVWSDIPDIDPERVLAHGQEHTHYPHIRVVALNLSDMILALARSDKFCERYPVQATTLCLLAYEHALPEDANTFIPMLKQIQQAMEKHS